ncbi:hypothetical protein K457DRAFT_19148 [Linnemannia elongata AG-77]|uniref:Uncharacterized protein n=1 Tax=Linnemannia elongata AG-77 TaxID=1314771 RepID=A0A197JYY7_9FUNG|nr:hypothetical protein K457DRAFT_19148 [Linnemannia elongata AG-77]
MRRYPCTPSIDRHARVLLKFFRILDDVRLREIQAALETSNRFCQAYKNIQSAVEPGQVETLATLDAEQQRQVESLEEEFASDVLALLSELPILRPGFDHEIPPAMQLPWLRKRGTNYRH